MPALTHQGAKFRISPTPILAADIPLDQAAFDAIVDYITLTGIVTAPSFRITQNVLSQATLDQEIAQKQGGIRSGEDTEVAFSFQENAGITALETAANSQNIYAVQYELNNSLGTNGTTYSAVCIVTGGGGPVGGGVEDFANLVFGLSPTDQAPLKKAAA